MRERAFVIYITIGLVLTTVGAIICQFLPKAGFAGHLLCIMGVLLIGIVLCTLLFGEKEDLVETDRGCGNEKKETD
ncbi:MAG: hypothetical protein CEN88_312 [Candidatus Berkelbacteria bacterium Licking1014_2]|uniref:Uncharacterized protein n=1 Tax=Candidatus Berkelbacteria bacterium Licking1014_2 TaxID=2017146 RepID=A0A554LUM8_9BACT|nr:MAG: hypothetical protein CEN88_312 [Candidatus Berkelbacteria bacterium Licking1014_2]